MEEGEKKIYGRVPIKLKEGEADLGNIYLEVNIDSGQVRLYDRKGAVEANYVALDNSQGEIISGLMDSYKRMEELMQEKSQLVKIIAELEKKKDF